MEEHLRNYLMNNKIFTKKELDTLAPSNINHCNMCNMSCGQLVELAECLNKTVICLQCLDDLHDNYHRAEELFECICCNTKIFSYNLL